MARVIITQKLKEKIYKQFKSESKEVFKLIYSLKENPHKGKPLTQVGGILVKELRYESYRFYFITDGFKIKMLQTSELTDLLIKFIRMSDKRNQQKTIEEIKEFLRNFGKQALEEWKEHNMKKQTKVYYDEEGDFLEFNIGEPKKGFAEEVEKGIFIRKDEETGQILGIGILTFKKSSGNLREI